MFVVQQLSVLQQIQVDADVSLHNYAMLCGGLAWFCFPLHLSIAISLAVLRIAATIQLRARIGAKAWTCRKSMQRQKGVQVGEAHAMNLRTKGCLAAANLLWSRARLPGRSPNSLL